MSRLSNASARPLQMMENSASSMANPPINLWDNPVELGMSFHRFKFETCRFCLDYSVDSLASLQERRRIFRETLSLVVEHSAGTANAIETIISSMLDVINTEDYADFLRGRESDLGPLTESGQDNISIETERLQIIQPRLEEFDRIRALIVSNITSDQNTAFGFGESLEALLLPFRMLTDERLVETQTTNRISRGFGSLRVDEPRFRVAKTIPLNCRGVIPLDPNGVILFMRSSGLDPSDGTTESVNLANQSQDTRIEFMNELINDARLRNLGNANSQSLTRPSISTRNDETSNLDALSDTLRVVYEQYIQGYSLILTEENNQEPTVRQVYDRIREELAITDSYETWSRTLRRARKTLNLPALSASPATRLRSVVAIEHFGDRPD